MSTAPSVDPGASVAQRLRDALAQLACQQASDSAIEASTASALCELAGVSRNALYRYHPDVLRELRNLQRRRHRDPCSTKRVLRQLRDENEDLRHQLAMVAALVDHYFAAWQETRALLERRERELAELRRNLEPKLVSIRHR